MASVNPTPAQRRAHERLVAELERRIDRADRIAAERTIAAELVPWIEQRERAAYRRGVGDTKAALEGGPHEG